MICPAFIGEKDVPHRSKGKGSQGLPHDTKHGVEIVTRDLKSFLQPHECHELARRYLEWAEEERQKNIERSRRYGGAVGNDFLSSYYGKLTDRAAHFAKKMR